MHELTQEDVVKFSEWHFDNSEHFTRARRRHRFGTPLVFLAVGAALGARDSTFAGLAIFAPIAAAWVIWWPSYARRNYRKQVAKAYGEGSNRGLFGTHELIAESDCLFHKTDLEESRLKWGIFERVERTEDYLFMYLTAVYALVIPRAGVCEGDFDQFAERCQALAA